MKETVLITGASSGIGEATAKLLGKNNYRLIITGRRKDRLEKLSNFIQSQFGTEVCFLNFDIRDFIEVKKAIDSLPDNFKQIDILINNAGLALGLDPIHNSILDDWEIMIDTNVKGLLYITKLISPQMVNRKKGYIINIGSIAGKEVYPNGNVYCATKHAVDALTKAMRIDLLPYGIKVSQIAPGMVNTEFSTVRFHGDKERADNVYQGLNPLVGEDIAEIILYLLKTPSHVCINDLVVMPLAQASATNVFRTE
jgi:hypothetical protein